MGQTPGTHLRCSRDRQLCGVQVPIPQLLLQHLGQVSIRSPQSKTHPYKGPTPVPPAGSSPTNPSPAQLSSYLQLRPSDDVAWVQHVPQGLAHLPALPVSNHGVQKHLGREGGRRRPGEPSRGPWALGLRVGRESGGGDHQGRGQSEDKVRDTSYRGTGHDKALPC